MILSRPLRSSAHRGEWPDIAEKLLDVMLRARDERARARARAAVESAWATNDAARDELWRAARRLLNAHYNQGAFRNDEVNAVLRFLLEPVPHCRYVPRVRLLTCLWPEPSHEERRAGDGEPELTPLIKAAIGDKDFPARDALLELLCTTDHPRLLTELTHALEKSPDRISQSDTRVVDDYDLWDDNGEPRPLLRILTTNPHLPLRPEIPDTALVSILRNRFDLLGEYDQETSARALVTVLATTHKIPAETSAARVVEGCRRALRELLPGAGRELVCQRAIAGDDESITAAIDAGYRPSNEELHPLFLFSTEQWDAYDRLDPNGEALISGLLTLPHVQIEAAVTHLLEVLGTHEIPPTAARKARSALRRLPAPPKGQDSPDHPETIARETVCHRAMWGDTQAKAAAREAGYRPSDKKLYPAFLFLTEQWDAYDRLKASTRLRKLLDESPRYPLPPLSVFEEVALRSGRRLPDSYDPSRHRRHRRRDRRRTGITGGYHTDYSSPGGDVGGGYDGGSFGSY
ncbi:hypothetical protein [Saccharomonospora glauca]|uniref:Uncharacterized protein n=1 Tax=Saccharomonospora glauca K62 TaxID=928724 RepID=I1D2M3_9PSEU|nr:hypothetical protein [Saccharomonospora glauca]EIE99197.1 hypothetical protein SacglDRAFT_02302 [Saccharomonospora glauca K62]